MKTPPFSWFARRSIGLAVVLWAVMTTSTTAHVLTSLVAGFMLLYWAIVLVTKTFYLKPIREALHGIASIWAWEFAYECTIINILLLGDFWWTGIAYSLQASIFLYLALDNEP